MEFPNFFIGPMSKNIVDTIIDFSERNNLKIGLIPSRRQVENTGGYVNGWKTDKFCEYVRSRSKNIVLVRDHAGPSQGQTDDDGIDSFRSDCGIFDCIHVDVWKKHQNYEDGLKKTIEFIELGYSINPDLTYEVGTEEAIRKFTDIELRRLLHDLRENLTPDIFSKIKYAVVQSGTGLLMNTNIGKYDGNRLSEMVSAVEEFGLISKEHNGDYINNEVIESKFQKGLDCINIAPEFGQIETKVILDKILTSGRDDLFDLFFRACLDSKKWVKWVSPDFIPESNKLELINICGHYVFSSQELKAIKDNFPGIDEEIKSAIADKLFSLLSVKEETNLSGLRKYFYLFSKKDINRLSEMFSDSVTLQDWEIKEIGKPHVVAANQKIFDSVESIDARIVSIYKMKDKEEYSCEIMITVNGNDIINVIDLIGFDDSGLINRIKAFKI